jgi:hypothetical protein
MSKTLVWDEAGKFAEHYQGSGWFCLRTLLVDFHQHMKKLESTGEPKRMKCVRGCDAVIAFVGEESTLCTKVIDACGVRCGTVIKK